MSKIRLKPVADLENNSTESIESVGKKLESMSKRKKDQEKEGSVRKKHLVVMCAIAISVICVIICIYYWSKAVAVSVAAATEAYGSAKDARVKELRQEYREMGYAKGEEEYHTSNRIAIKIDNVKETAKLEVMLVSDVVYIINDDQNHVWTKATGTGVYTVNLAAGEYLIDSERQYVLVRVPKPELTVNLDNVERLFFKNEGFKNGSIGEGEELARKQRSDAQIQLLKDIKENQEFYEYAEDSAITLIKSLVREFNLEIPELKVDVEFFD